MSCLTEDEMRNWLTKLREAMKANVDITSEIARNKKPSGMTNELNELMSLHL